MKTAVAPLIAAALLFGCSSPEGPETVAPETEEVEEAEETDPDEEAAEQAAEEALQRRQETLDRQREEREAEEAEPEPRSAAPYLGDDLYFNELADLCAQGDEEACDELYWESPLDSAYESYALDQMYPGRSGNAGSNLDDGELYDLVFQMTWEGLSSAERNEFCDGYNMFGADFMYPHFAEGFGADAPTLSQFRDFFDSVC